MSPRVSVLCLIKSPPCKIRSFHGGDDVASSGEYLATVRRSYSLPKRCYLPVETVSHTGRRQRSHASIWSHQLVWETLMSRSKFLRIAQVLTRTSARVLRIASTFIHTCQCSLFRRGLTVSRADPHISESFAERCNICPNPSNRYTVDCDCSAGVFIVISILRTAAIWFYCLSPILIWLLLSGC
jgi:hypothetical protein